MSAMPANIPVQADGAGAVAIATQAMANVADGPEVLNLLDQGMSDPEAIALLAAGGDRRDHRQVGVVDRNDIAATFTGAECLDWAGGRTGVGFACHGKILAGAGVLDAMAGTLASSDADLSKRLVEALLAGPVMAVTLPWDVRVYAGVLRREGRFL